MLRNRFLNVLHRTLSFKRVLRYFYGYRLLLLLGIFMLGFILFSLFSPYFQIKKITITRNNPYVNIEQVKHTLQSLYGKNLLFLKKEEVISQLKEDFPFFQEIRLTESWPNEIQIAITASDPAFTILNQYDANFSVLSKDGYVLAHQADENLPLLKIEDYPKSLTKGMRLVPPKVIKDIAIIQAYFKEKLKIPIKEIRIFPMAQEIHVISEAQTAFWFDYQQEVLSQLKKIELAAETIGLYKNPPEHVDLRIPKQLFWKEKTP